MYLLQFDPATFAKHKKGEFEAAYAAHVDDCLTVGKKKTLEDMHDKMVQKLQYGEVQTIPAKFLGINISKNLNAKIVHDQKHYLDGVEVPDMQQLQGFAKQDVLPERLQSMFRSLTSKLVQITLLQQKC